MKELNILIVVDTYIPGYGNIPFRFAKGLKKRGHNVSILAGRFESSIPLSTETDGITFYNYYKSGRSNFIFFIFKTIYQNFKIFKIISKNIQLDFICFLQPLSALGVMLNKKSKNIPKLYFFQGPWDREYELNAQMDNVSRWSLLFLWYKINSYLRRLSEDIAIKHCIKITAASNFMRDQIIKKHRIEPHSIEIIPNCVDTGLFRPGLDKAKIRKTLGLPEDKKIILSVRRLVPRMGLENLIQAMAIITKKAPDAYLVIVGEGFLRDRLKKMTSDLGLQEFINFTGGVYTEESLVRFYQAADLFVLPTKELEGFGIIIIEALSSNLCILATPVGAIPEVLGSFNRDLLFKGITPQDIAELTTRYLEDNKLRENMVTGGRDYVIKNYSLEVVAEKLERIFTIENDYFFRRQGAIELNQGFLSVKPLKLLVILLGGIGDALWFLPTLKAIHEAYPNFSISILSGYNKSQSVFEGRRFAYNCIIYKKDKFSILSNIKLINMLRKEKFDIAITPVHLFLSYKSSLLNFLSGAPVKIGPPENILGFLYNFPIKGERRTHVIERNLYIAKFLGVEVDDTDMKFPTTKEEEEFANAALAKNNILPSDLIIGFTPSCGGNAQIKKWPEERFASVISTLTKDYKARIIGFGGKDEIFLGQKIKRLSGVDFADFIGRATLGQTAALLSKCKIFIGVDTGLTYLAVAMGCTVIAIFGPSDSKRVGPIGSKHRIINKCITCSPCFPYKLHCNKTTCLKLITPEDVILAVDSILNEKPT